MYFYGGDVNYNRKQQPTLWQQAMLSKSQEQELYNFLSIGCGGRCREKSRQLNLALQKKKQLKVFRTKVIKIMRGIGLDKGFAKKIALLLEKSGLSLDEQREVAKNIKRLLLDFNRGLHNLLDLKGLKLSRLPLSLRRFIIALIVLKAEIANLYRLQLEGLEKMIKRNREPQLTNDDRKLYLQKMDLDLDNHKKFTMGISLTKGDWDGTRGMFTERNGRDINFENKTTKRERNCETNKQKNEKKYYQQEKNFNDKESEINKNDFYEDKNKSTSYYFYT